MRNTEVFRAYPAECVGMRERNTPALEKAVPITVTVYQNGARDVSCPFLRNGDCATSQNEDVKLPFQRCIQLFPGSSELVNPLLTKSEIEILRAVARTTIAEVVQETVRGKSTVKGHLSNAYRKLNVCSQTGAILKCVNMGILDLNTLVDEEDLSVVCNLIPRQRNVMKTLLENGGQEDGLKEVGKKMGLSPGTIKKHLSQIYSVLYVNNKTQAALLFLAAQRKGIVE